MEGYYKRPDLTAETVINGWLHTGDIGIWDEGNIKITDRKKELFKTSGGKYVAPQPIENKMKESPFIEQIMIVGSERKFVGALIVPAFAHLQSWLHHKNIAFNSIEQALQLPEVKEKFQHTIDEMNENFNKVEQVKKFELLPKEWSVEGGEMTPKLSLKRKVVMEKYKSYVDKIYAE
jgi:long-chain acyl-CoA synthetase